MATNVDALITEAANQARAMAADAEAALADASNAFADLQYPNPLTFSTPAGYYPERAGTAPQMLGGDFVAPAAPGAAPTTQVVPEFSGRPIPVFAETMPTLNEPVMPSALPEFTGVAPVPGTLPTLPVAPGMFSGTPPVLSVITLPTAPVLPTRSFMGTRPGDMGDAPDVSTLTDTQYRQASDYITAKLEGEVDRFIDRIDPEFRTQFSALEAKLSQYMAGGETGLSVAAENAIYERSKAKTNAEAARVQQGALLDAARRGFTLPSGALMSAMQQARQAGADNNAAAAREIVVMQAEMNQKNIQFAITQSANLRQVVIGAALNYHQGLVQINGQAVQLAQAVVEGVVKAYGLRVEAYQARLEGYKADVVVYDSLIKADLASVEVYKALIEGEKTKADMDMARIQSFKALVDAHMSQVEVYKASIEGVMAAANLEKLKVEIFQSQVQAFTARVQAKTAEWQGYASAWNGEESKVKAFLAQAQAFAAEVDGFRAEAAVFGERVSAIGVSNQAVLGAHKAEVDAYTATIQGAAAKAAAEVGMNDVALKAYQAENEATVAYNRAVAERWQAYHATALAEAKARFDSEMDRIKTKVGQMQGTGELALGIGRVYAGMAQSAMSGVTTLVRADPA